MQGKILVIGSSNMDMIVKVPCLPKPGETILGGNYFKALGGKGANQAVSAARAGGKVSFITCIGNDDLGQQFRNDSINTEFIGKNKKLLSRSI